MQFLDQAKIHVKSGAGGAGSVSFHRAKYIEHGGPDGGDGGKGGDIIAKAVANLNTLIDFRYQQHFKAEIGGHGMGKNRHGANGKNTIINVPIGTQIYEMDKTTLITDLTHEGEQFCLAQGGKGGFGNAHFKTATNQAPRHANPGQQAQEFSFWLRLKLIADVGIIGLPNAGKSTFLATITKAKPKIADYPFTTLYPNLGVADYYGQQIIIADIPGLIKGATTGSGIGDRFLGHVERANILLHLISAEESNVIKAYQTVRQEIENYEGKLTNKHEIIALSKIDMLKNNEIIAKQNELQQATGKQIFLLSSLAKIGLNELIKTMAQQIKKSNEKQLEKNSRWQPLEQTPLAQTPLAQTKEIENHG